MSGTAWVFHHLAERIANGFDDASTAFGSVEISVKVHADSESSPADADCYTSDEIAKFGGYWTYIGIELTVSAPGVTATASLWGVEHGISTAELEALYLAQDVLPNLFREARDSVRDAREAFDRFGASLSV